MYHSSTQRKFWTFANEAELMSHRRDAHRRFIQQRIDQRDCVAVRRVAQALADDLSSGTLDAMSSLEDHLHPENPRVAGEFLTLDEENELRRFYQSLLRDFCSKFTPEMPKSTIATAFAFFQRAYVNESVMHLHPKHMMITCMWIALKVDEHHVTMDQFVAHLRGDRQKAVDIIIRNEPYVMKKLHFQLLVHLPYRACEGFLIDIKTRYADRMAKVDRLRPAMDKFLETSMMSDALLLFPPSQIALAALTYAAGELQEDLSDYVERVLVGLPITKPFAESGDSEDRAEEAMEQDEAALGSQTSIHLLAIVAEIRHHVLEFGKLTVSKDRLKRIEAKLESCRDPAFNPETAEYSRRIAKLFQIDLENEV
ncbi:putative Cyclin-H [Hypsibius exemplaris]|uniref:Cyclin-H n=1 Tax=Hypsibius exemplaris TaxID=2072580 RepID=A0A1W0WTV3_HYPEX|nr:putative Cyclin-H [Hypsibius exemplaris]